MTEAEKNDGDQDESETKEKTSPEEDDRARKAWFSWAFAMTLAYPEHEPADGIYDVPKTL